MKATPIAGCEKALEQAKARLAFLGDFEAARFGIKSRAALPPEKYSSRRD